MEKQHPKATLEQAMAKARPVVENAREVSVRMATTVSHRVCKARDNTRPVVRRAGQTTVVTFRNAAAAVKPVATRTGRSAAAVAQRSGVRLRHADRRRLSIVGASLLGLALVALLVPTIAGRIADDSPRVAAPAPSVATPGFVLERISHGRDGNLFALAGGTPLFPLPSGGLSDYEGQPVEMQGVPVQAVVADNGMWVGESPEQRVFVTLSREGAAAGSPTPGSYEVGERLNLSGRFVPVASFDQLGVSLDEGAEQLFAQGVMVEAVSLRPPTPAPVYDRS